MYSSVQSQFTALDCCSMCPEGKLPVKMMERLINVFQCDENLMEYLRIKLNYFPFVSRLLFSFFCFFFFISFFYPVSLLI